MKLKVAISSSTTRAATGTSSPLALDNGEDYQLIVMLFGANMLNSLQIAFLLKQNATQVAAVSGGA